MPLTPQEIQTQEFHVRFRGFDVEEVDAFLERIAADYASLIEQNKKLTEQVESLNQEMADYQSKGKAFQHAILSAQQIADELKDKSAAEAEQMVAEARSEAEEIRKTANAEIAALEVEVDRLENLRDESRNELKRMLNGYLQMLDAEPAPVAPEPPPIVETVFDEPEPELEASEEPEPIATEEEPQPEPEEDDLSDLYQKIDLADDDALSAVADLVSDAPTLDTVADLVSNAPSLAEPEAEPEVLVGDDEPYSAIPDLDDEVVFSLDDPLDANEPSVDFEDLVPKDDK